MIPNIDILLNEITEVSHPSKTYKIVTVEYSETERLVGYVDDIEAIQQAIYLILNTERYEFPIYSWDYGIELVDLIGKPMPYVIAEIPRRVTEALTQDNRIADVVDFEFTMDKHKLHTKFKVITTVGAFMSELEVTV